MKQYLKVLRKYADFQGRAHRKEYWMFSLYNLIIALLITAFGILIFGEIIGMRLSAFYFLVLFVPTLAVSVRRLHDIDKSGWWLLVNLLPFIGTVIYVVLMAQNSYPIANEFGKPLKYRTF